MSYHALIVIVLAVKAATGVGVAVFSWRIYREMRKIDE